MTRGNNNSLVREAQRIIDEYVRDAKLEAGDRRIEKALEEERKQSLLVPVILNVLLLIISIAFIWYVIKFI